VGPRRTPPRGHRMPERRSGAAGTPTKPSPCYDQELAVSGEPTGDRELSMSRAVPVAREAVR
jgi:hypothetical protein